MDELDELVRALDAIDEFPEEVLPPLVHFNQDKYDHYTRVGDEEECESREPSGGFYQGDVPVPEDAHPRCKSCLFAERCFAAEMLDLDELDIIEVDVDESEWSDNY